MSLHIRTVLSQPFLSVLGLLAIHRTPSEDSDQTARMHKEHFLFLLLAFEIACDLNGLKFASNTITTNIAQARMHARYGLDMHNSHFKTKNN